MEFQDRFMSMAPFKIDLDLRTTYEVAQKQGEVDLLEKESEVSELLSKRPKFIIYGIIISLFLVRFLSLSVLHRNKYIKKTTLIIEEEKDRSDNLLLNILPAETAQELIKNGKVKAKNI